MDRHALAMLIPVLGLTFTGLLLFSFTRLGRALARRIESGADPAAGERFAQLEGEVEQLRRELVEVQERLDFSERLLARAAGDPALPGDRRPLP